MLSSSSSHPRQLGEIDPMHLEKPGISGQDTHSVGICIFVLYLFGECTTSAVTLLSSQIPFSLCYWHKRDRQAECRKFKRGLIHADKRKNMQTPHIKARASLKSGQSQAKFSVMYSAGY